MSILPLLSQSLFILSQVPEALRFLGAWHTIKSVQERLLGNYLRKNQDTNFGKEHTFAAIHDVETYRKRVPIRTYQDFLPYIEAIQQGQPRILTAEDVRYFLPTGGTTGTKLIPYTTALKREFQNALAPWLVDVVRTFPAILNGKTYWSITPPGNRLKKYKEQPIPVGFEEDSAYFGWKGYLLGNLFAAPSWITRLHSIDNFRFLTLYFLLREQNLRWLSIWSPTFFLVLLDELERRAESLCAAIHTGIPQLPEREELPVVWPVTPMKVRAKSLEQFLALPPVERYGKIWPHLSFMSLWQDAYARYPAQQLARLFPNTYFQGKGLLATEGVMTIPLHDAHGCIPAFTSHFFEFVQDDQETRGVWELAEGQTYSLLLTTGGGLYRYAIGDLVTVTGFYRNLPILRFVGRQGRFSDLAGEKLVEQFVNEALECVLKSSPIDFSFLLVAPEEWEVQHYSPALNPERKPSGFSETLRVSMQLNNAGSRGYVLFIESFQDEKPILAFAQHLDGYLRTNVHYNFAVKMGQITLLQVFLISQNGQKAYIERCVADGQKMGDIKPLWFDTRTGWQKVFQGRFL
jgi:hypothetical protein